MSPDAPPDSSAESLPETLLSEHRRLDELFGRFLSAASAGDLAAAAEAIGRFDTLLRRHTSVEEERVYPQPTGRKLVASTAPESSPQEESYRQLRIEHVQIRELSGMILRLLSENRDLDSAMRLAGNLARRWDAHTEREEREVYARGER